MILDETWHMFIFLVYLLEKYTCSFNDEHNVTSNSVDFNKNAKQNDTINNAVQNFNHDLEIQTSQLALDDCKVRPCIQICCRGEQENCIKTEQLKMPTKSGGEVVIDLTSNEFTVLIGKPCNEMYIMEPLELDIDRWYFDVSIKC